MIQKKWGLTRLIKVKKVKAEVEAKNPNKKKFQAKSVLNLMDRMDQRVSMNQVLRILWLKATFLMEYLSATMRFWTLMMTWTSNLALRSKNLWSLSKSIVQVNTNGSRVITLWNATNLSLGWTPTKRRKISTNIAKKNDTQPSKSYQIKYKVIDQFVFLSLFWAIIAWILAL